MLAWALLVLAAVAMLWLVVPGVMVVTTMATLPMEEASTVVTSVGTVALLQATTAMAAMEALLLAVSGIIIIMHDCRVCTCTCVWKHANQQQNQQTLGHGICELMRLLLLCSKFCWAFFFDKALDLAGVVACDVNALVTKLLS